MVDKVAKNKRNRPYVNKYDAKMYEKMTFRVKKSGDDGLTGDRVRSAAAAAGESVNAWIVEAIRQRLERESRPDAP